MVKHTLIGVSEAAMFHRVVPSVSLLFESLSHIWIIRAKASALLHQRPLVAGVGTSLDERFTEIKIIQRTHEIFVKAGINI